MNILTRTIENKAEQELSASFIVSPALSVNAKYSVTPSHLTSSIGSVEECSSGINSFSSSVLSGHFPTNSQNQYHHHTINFHVGIFHRL